MQVILNRMWLEREAFRYVEEKAKRELQEHGSERAGPPDDFIYCPSEAAWDLSKIEAWRRIAADGLVDSVVMTMEEYGMYSAIVRRGEKLRLEAANAGDAE